MGIKNYLACLAISLIFFIKGYAQNSPDIKKDVNNFVEKYAPGLNQLIINRGFDFDFYCNTNDKEKLYSCFPAIIHERVHSYNNSLNTPKQNGARKYFFNGDIIEIKNDTVFKTSLIDKIVPQKLSATDLRYKTYVMGSNAFEGELNPDTRENGIYGLLEEFTAYYYGCLVYSKQYTYLKNIYPYDSTNAWITYLWQRGNIISAYYEFKLFIAYYFLYAKDAYPVIFKELSTNKSLNKLIAGIDREFKLLVDEYWVHRAEIIAKSNHKILVMDGFILSLKSNERLRLPDKDIDALKSYFTPELTSVLNVQ